MEKKTFEQCMLEKMKNKEVTPGQRLIFKVRTLWELSKSTLEFDQFYKIKVQRFCNDIDNEIQCLNK